jgi:hypothetical protein
LLLERDRLTTILVIYAAILQESLIANGVFWTMYFREARDSPFHIRRNAAEKELRPNSDAIAIYD